jgi:ABC-2 type transport system permease protein
MRRAWILAKNDLLQVVKDRPSLFWLILMPIGFIYLFSTFGGSRGPERIGLAVIDGDGSVLSRTFTDALRQESYLIRELTPASVETTQVRRSVYIAPGFQDSIVAGRQAPIVFHASEAADATATLAAEMHVRRAIIQTLVALARASGAQTDSAAAGSPGMGSVMEWGASAPSVRPLRVDAAFAGNLARAAAEPRRIAVRTETAGRGRPVPSGMGQSLPATIALFMLINTTIYGAIFLAQERQEGMLARIATHAMSPFAIFGGKLLGSMLIALLEAAVLLLAGKLLFGAFIGNSLLGLALVVVCFALVVASLALVWGAVLRKPEQVTAVALVVSLFLGAIGGCWWPLEVVPAWMRAAGHISPAAWAMDGFHAIISYGDGPAAVVIPCLVLLGYAALLLGIGSRLLRVTSS